MRSATLTAYLCPRNYELGSGVVSSETDKADEYRQVLGLTPETHVVVISTEGATDPEAYKKIVG
jgi:hypothetical protein